MKIPPSVSIIPPTGPAYIEMVVLGLRNLLHYNFQAIQNPYLEIETGNEHGGKPEITITKTSKKPSPNNANFLERFIIEAKLPINPIFAQPILLRVIDTRLGRYHSYLYAMHSLI